ncbi:MAG: NAD(P)H-binding protein [Chloroflexi bacterium]|jgi:uncharacterized protein YbjT (DUF2867 family)|nr:NAD(P)H-binding protein [Chloroflexota bacterium]MBT3669868.1 NAD(P)H-binding protein [Chloroflexota bacterium]MBT4002472.1 NAD(P)H-binding protein [Chloroflexota bacterium]MBT4304770.1 NAD(P)H-binding protein [Chloroflexota bacterium]MBT4534729.1 NAD(P)H-binding protein [Chloroflexota bacterium]
MILVTGGTGFIGSALIRHLVEEGRKVRVLLRPSSDTPNLPTGIPLEIAIGNISDEKNLRSAMIGVDTIYHLAGAEWQGVRADLNEIEITGIKSILKAAQDAGIKRIVYISHIGADRASAYPVLKVKGITEEFIRKSGITYTIIRSSLVFGPNDHFTTALAKLMSLFPIFFPIPGDGQVMFQPIWIEDLAACLSWSLDREEMKNQTYTIGGPEFISLSEVFHKVADSAGIRRKFFSLPPTYFRLGGVLLEYFLPGLPLSVYWLDYLSTSRTCEIDTVSRIFGLLPSRFEQHLGHLKNQKWLKLAFKDMRFRKG